MKIFLKIILLSILPAVVFAQQSVPDSLRNIINNGTNDSVRYKACWAIINSYYGAINRDTALYVIEQALSLARKNNKKLPEARAQIYKGHMLSSKGRYAESLKCLLEAFTIAENPESEKNTWIFDDNFSPQKSRLSTLSYAHNIFALIMIPTQNTEQQFLHNKESRKIAEGINDSVRIITADISLGRTYLELSMLDSALFFMKEAEHIALQYGHRKSLLSIILYRLGDIYLQLGDKVLAKQYFYQSIQAAEESNNKIALVINYLRLTNYYRLENEKDSALYYAIKYAETFQSLGISATEFDYGTAYESLSLAYKLNNQFDSAFKYQGLALVTKDSLNKARIKSLAEFQNLTYREQLRLQDLEKERIRTQNRNRNYAMLAGLSVFLIIAVILYSNNRQKHKANKVLVTTLTNLKSTQAQLIQSEKMASLGELTAGIAHEIQNPLNFVNNFSEMNGELIEELLSEKSKEKSERDDALEIELLQDLKENEQKINHHGKRADAIVKGMLQHSKASTGNKELTDINKLADEYMRLSYHGLRAKDKEFNADIKTEFDESIGKINVVPQDIGRVMLNLISNAFYAVIERQKVEGVRFKPTVSIQTKKLNDKIEIRVQDNGNGIPQKLLDKIFQPFFTTKPTGEGTGLGLSLSYDIIKAHGGEIKVETKEEKGTIFTILLPSKEI